MKKKNGIQREREREREREMNETQYSKIRQLKARKQYVKNPHIHSTYLLSF
jgi:hypothetical protein